MSQLGFTVLYTPIEDGWYMAQVLELPEAISQGETLEEAREMIRDALLSLVADLSGRVEELEEAVAASSSSKG